MKGITLKDGKVDSQHEKEKRKQLKRIDDADVRAELLWREEQQE